jgi:hypothetical protein
MNRADCSAWLAVWLLSNPILSPWGKLHSIKLVSIEMGMFVGDWPLIPPHSPTIETGKLRCRKVRK